MEEFKMTEKGKTCYSCEYFKLQGDFYHSVEHCVLHNITQKSPTDHIEVCSDWKKKTKFSGVYKVIGVLKGRWKE